MLHRVLGLLAAAVACGATGVALASPQFASTVTFTYSSQVPGLPSGFDSYATFSDPGEPGGKPKELIRIKVGFHPGTRIDTAALPRCRASDRKVQLLGLRACPASTSLGIVHAESVVSSGLHLNPVGHLFNARRAIIVVATIGGRYATSFRDDLTRDTLTVNFRIPPGISFIQFKPHIPRHFRKRAGKRRAYMRTPPSCPATGVWTTTVVFIYRDGSTQEHSAPTPCVRAQR
jgi:hypothetical protein